jgi:cytochrome c-type biogenesis protein CcmH
MIWLGIVLLAAIALAPLALSLRRTAAARGRQEAAIALHRAQLAELDRDLADGRIAAAEHANAVLEVQRRLLAAAHAREAQEAALIVQLRRRLNELDPHGEQAHQGYILLGNAEASRGRLQEAADAWRTALATRFDPTIAAEAAEAITEVQGHVTEEAAMLFRQALAQSPADAPWRPMAEKRLSELK